MLICKHTLIYAYAPSWHFILQLPAAASPFHVVRARLLFRPSSLLMSRLSRAIRQQRRLIYCRRATIICNGKLFSIWQQRHTHTGGFFPLLVCMPGNLYQQWKKRRHSWDISAILTARPLCYIKRRRWMKGRKKIVREREQRKKPIWPRWLTLTQLRPGFLTQSFYIADARRRMILFFCEGRLFGTFLIKSFTCAR